MRDAQVVGLRYEVTHSSSVDFNKAPPKTWVGPDFTVTLENQEAKVELNAGYASVREARQAVDPFMRAWSVLAEVNGDPGVFGLEYRGAVLKDGNPAGKGALGVHSGRHAHSADRVRLHVSHGKYPASPVGFRVDVTVEAMHLHYSRYRSGAEPLPMAAYFCLTALEMEYGGGHRGRAARSLHVSRVVMQTFGRLASTATGPDARKFESHKPTMDSSGVKERRWLLAAMRLLILRAGECVAVNRSELPKITMADLPSVQ